MSTATSENLIVCPICGNEHNPDDYDAELTAPGQHTFECEMCGEEFGLNVSTSYMTYELDEDDDNEEDDEEDDDV